MLHLNLQLNPTEHPVPETSRRSEVDGHNTGPVCVGLRN